MIVNHFPSFSRPMLCHLTVATPVRQHRSPATASTSDALAVWNIAPGVGKGPHRKSGLPKAGVPAQSYRSVRDSHFTRSMLVGTAERVPLPRSPQASYNAICSHRRQRVQCRPVSDGDSSSGLLRPRRSLIHSAGVPPTPIADLTPSFSPSYTPGPRHPADRDRALPPRGPDRARPRARGAPAPLLHPEHRPRPRPSPASASACPPPLYTPAPLP